MSLQHSTLKFAKYQGLGNDFVLIDNTKSSIPLLSALQAKSICDRNFGVGADGVIMAMPGTNDCDYTMKIFNSDGSEPQMCGNGVRCLAKFIKLIKSDDFVGERSYKIWTNAGVVTPKLLCHSVRSLVRVDMGEPTLSGEKIPTTLESSNGMVVETNLEVLGHTLTLTAVSMGNPHAVVFVDDLGAMDPPFHVIGPAVESHSAFPERVNVEFVQVLSHNHLKMKVWERGAGATLACGTGACAVLVAGVLTHRAERNCTVTLPGGDLLVEWCERDNRVYMTGPATLVFEGTLAENL